MAYFAEIDESSIVTRVIAVSDEDTQDENGNEVESIGAEFCNKLLGLSLIHISEPTRPY